MKGHAITLRKQIRSIIYSYFVTNIDNNLEDIWAYIEFVCDFFLHLTNNFAFDFNLYFIFTILSVSRLMGGSASGSMGHMSNMGSLAACSVSDSKPMQFPLAQRRKRRVLFTQAQVSTILCIKFGATALWMNFQWVQTKG